MSPPIDRAASLGDTARAVTFSNSVLAISITLLVLDLHRPELSPGRLLPGLLAQ
jgi:uncharacterized membrane protein